MEMIHKIGRRKTAVARVYMEEASKAKPAGVTINGKEYKSYFNTAALHYKIEQPLKLTENLDKFHLRINVDGGGITGQAEAVRMAISRALCQENEENRAALKPEGLLTRDPRMVERKKFGQKKARKKFQFSKR
jgi:small subunit ribosomal protein S9